jgi:stage V sporulation protein R
MDLPQGLYLEFLQRHNLVIRPHRGRINPYYLGFKMFSYLDEQAGGRENIREARAQERDSSFIRRYLTRELCEEMNLFSYKIRGNDILVKEVSDDEGWKMVRDDLANSVGLGGIPFIHPLSVEKGVLMLEHLFDGRELEMSYARETLKHIVDLWGAKVELSTVLEGKLKIIGCSEDKMITIRDK